MRSGELDRRITIQTRQADQDAYGQPTDVWTDTVTVWAQLVPQSGGERFTADQRSAEQTVKFRVRYRPGINPGQRVIFDGRPHDLKDVSEPDRRRELVLTCTVLEVRSGVTP